MEGRQTKRRREALGRTEELIREQQEMEERAATPYTFRHAMPEESDAAERTHSKAKRPHTVVWAFLSLVFLICLLSLLLFMAPQLLGIRYRTLPNIVFHSGTLVEMDEERLRDYRQTRESVRENVFYPGVSVDGISLGGLTMEEARRQVEAVSAGIGSPFALNVQVAGKTWTVSSDMVPMQRNVEDVLLKAYALGRQNTQGAKGLPPMMEREQMREQMLMQPIELNTTLSYDLTKLRDVAEQITQQVNVPFQNAEVLGFDMASRTFSISEDVPGLYADPEKLYQAMLSALYAGQAYGTVGLDPVEVVADVTRAELRNRLTKVSSYTTSTTSNQNRNTNVRLSSEAINGVMVEPGAIFSFNQATGQRTVQKGYKEATAISGGQSIPEVGGGVCQTSSTLFNAVARANLEIVSRSPHAWPSSYVEKGMDATVNWPDLDFRFRNNTDYPIYILSGYASQKVWVEIYGLNLEDGKSIELESKVTRTIPIPEGIKEVRNEELKPGTRKTTVKGRKGYEVETWQVWYQGGKEISRNLLCKSTYRAYQETIEYN
ncbi:MAG: VanW family protein [Clostridia bacterium]|nr:VanW family protein [Clostridia bacterium]